jgi:hypothetical protein
MSICDIQKNFQTGAGIAPSTRGAYNYAPSEGSSNILNGGITPGPTAGKYAGTLDEIIGKGIGWSMSPEGQAEQRKAALEFYKAQGDQQMKYRLTNDIIANLGAGARAAFAGYTDPGEIARMTAGIGDAYARGAAATEGLTRLGAGVPITRYYNV